MKAEVLIEATRKRRVSEIVSLLKSGLNPDELGPKNITALMWAAASDRPEALEIARLLTEAGANPNLSDDWGRTALGWAAQQGRTKSAMNLLMGGADPNAKAPQGTEDAGATALHWAARHGSSDVARVLLAAGARATEKSETGETPWEKASNNGFDALAGELRAEAEREALKASTTEVQGAKRKGL